ncbi:NAD(P)-binding protein [Xylariomycetidae sp. FL2044]|nr:NAD(P)-binding protein [Xylariomycetidae sp. FL2044]
MASREENGKVAIVTGSSMGIGLDVAKHLHGRGYRVAITSRTADAGRAAAVSIDPKGEAAIFVQSDVASYSSQANLFKETWKRWGRLDLAILNAGFVDRDSKYNFGRKNDAAVDDLPPEPDTSATDVNYKGVIYGTTLATHFMRHNATPGGRIIVTGSILGMHTCPTFPEYCSSKAGVHQWVRTMAPLLRLHENIAINTVMPGGFATEAMPGFAEAFLPEHLCVPAALMKAYDVFLDDDDDDARTGQCLEVAHDQHYFHEVPEYKGGAVSHRATLAYEPWFAMIHGQKSGLPDALQGPPKREAKASL